jgi:hypothetical protein
MAKTIGAAPETGFLGLQVVLLTKIRKEQITFEHLRGFLKMSKADRDKQFGKRLDNLKLMQQGIVIPALTETFDPQREFTQDEKVRYWPGDNFKKYLLNVTVPFSNLAKAVVDKSLLKYNTTDIDIMAEIEVSKEDGLLSKEDILWRIHHLTLQQPNGEAGALNNNGFATIIGYFLCDDGIVRVAYVRWDSDDREWRCNVGGLAYWREGSGVLSRNGVLNA